MSSLFLNMKKAIIKIFDIKLVVLFSIIIFTTNLNAQTGYADITINNSTTTGGDWSVLTNGVYTFTPSAVGAYGANIKASDIISHLSSTSAVNILTTCTSCYGSGNVTLAYAINTGTTIASTLSINTNGIVSLPAALDSIHINGATVSINAANGIIINANITSANVNLNTSNTTTTSGINDGQKGGKITATNLTFNGTGKLNLSSTCSISGTTTFSNGYVQLGAALNLSNLILDTYLNLNGFNLTLTSLTGATSYGQNGVIANGGSNPVVLKDSATSSTTFAGLIKDSIGTIALTKLGSSTSVLTLTRANLFSAATTISSGGIQIQHSTALGSTSGITISSGGLQLSGGINVNYPLNMTGSGVSNTGALRSISGMNRYNGSISLTGATTIYADADTLYLNPTNPISGTNTNLTISGASLGVINFLNTFSLGNGTLTKSGSSIAILKNSNSYSGATSISGGALNIQNQNALGSSTNAVAISNTGQLQLQGGITFSLPLNISSTSSTGALRSISGINKCTGLITLTGSASIFADADTLYLMASPNSISSSNNSSVTLGGNGNVFVPSIITIGTGSLTKSGTGILYLNATNAYSGNTTVSGGVLKILTAGAIPSNTVYTIDGILDLNGNSISVSNLNSTGSSGLITNSLASSTATITIAGKLTTGSITYQGAISDSLGAIALVKNDVGTQILSGNNKYSGVTNINQGIIEVQSNNALGTTSGSTVVSNGAVLRAYAASTTLTIPENISLNGLGINNNGALFDSTTSGSRSVTFSGSILPQSNIRINSNARVYTAFSNSNLFNGGEGKNINFGGTGIITINGNIKNDSIYITKDSTGTLNLTNSNTYSGATIVKGGILNISNNNALGTTSGMQVYGGSTLQLQNVTITNIPLKLGYNNTNGKLSSNLGSNSWLYTNSDSIFIVGNDTAFITSDAAGATFTLPNISGTNTVLSLGGASATGAFSLNGKLVLRAGSLYKTGSNTVSLINSNIYTGHTKVLGGTLNFTDIGQLGSTDSIFVSGNGVLQIQGGQTVAKPLTMGWSDNSNATLSSHGGNNTWSNTINLLGTGNAIFTQDSANTIFTLNNITGAQTSLIIGAANYSTATFNLNGGFNIGTGNLTKNGIDTLRLGNQNSYSGTTTISGGALYISNSNQIGSGNVIVGNAGQIQLASSLGVTINRPLTTSSTISTGAIRNILGRNFWTGAITLTANTIFRSDLDTLTLGNISSSNNNNVSFLGTGNFNVNGIIATNTGSVTKDSTGSLQLFGVNSYSGKTTITKGNLILANANVISNNSDVYFNGGTLQANYDQSVGKIYLWDNSNLNLGTIGTINFSGYGNFDFKKLTINNWQGSYDGNSGIRFKFFVNGATKMTNNELDQITFSNGANFYQAYQLATNEIVPSTSLKTGFANVRIVNSAARPGNSGTTNSFLNGSSMPSSSNGTWALVSGTYIFTPNTDNAFLLTRDIETYLASNNVTITNNCNICSQSGYIKSDGVISVNNGSTPKLLSLNATTDIFVIATIDVTTSTQRNGSNLILNANGNNGTGNISILANLKTALPGGANSNLNGGFITINSNKGINLNASLLSAGSTNGLAGDITINNKDTTSTIGGSNEGQIGGAINGGNLIKTGFGTFAFKSSNTYTGYTKLSSGKLQLNNSECIPNSSKFYLDGGSFVPNGYNETMDSLVLTNNSNIYLDSTKMNSINFSGMRLPTDTTKRLSIYNWVGAYTPLAITWNGKDTSASQNFIKFNGKRFSSTTSVTGGLNVYGRIITGDVGQTQIMGHIYINSILNSTRLFPIQFWNTFSNKFYTALQQTNDYQIVPGIAR